MNINREIQDKCIGEASKCLNLQQTSSAGSNRLSLAGDNINR